MSEVFPWTNLKCEEITVAVYWMQNLQLLSNTGEKRCEYYTCILTHTIFSVVGLKVDPILCIPEDLLRFVKPLLCTIGLIFPKKKKKKDFKWRGCYMYATGTSFTHACCSLSGWDAVLRFMWSGLSHGMLRSAAFKNAKRWGVYTVWLLCFPPLLSIQSLFFTDGRLGLSLSTQRSSGGLLGALHAYQIIPASPGRFAISGLQYWPYSEACNDGARTVVGYLAGNSYKSHSWAQQADTKSILPNRELTQCFSYGFSLCAE